MTNKTADYTPIIKLDLKRADVGDLIRKDPLLSGSRLVVAGGAAFEKWLARAIARRCADRVVIFQRGDTGDSLYFVLSGEVRVFGRKETDGVELTSVVKGQVIGEREVLTGDPVRSVSAIAHGPTGLAEIPRTALLEGGRLPGKLRAYLAEIDDARNKQLDELNEFMKRW